MNKKAFIGITLTVGVLLVLALIVLVVFGGLSLFAWILGVTLWRLAGIIIIGLVVLSFLKGRIIPTNVAIVMLLIGFVLVLLPFFSDVFSQHTVGAILRITP